MNETPQHTAQRDNGSARGSSHLPLVCALVGLVAGMGAMAYAAVPLYQIFCQVTGYGGTTQRADRAPDQILDKQIEVRLDANTARGLRWRFHAAVKTVNIKIGETALVHYEAENISDQPISGTATFNVTPDAAGVYFNKIECFCFTEQRLEPGQRVDMPVTFFIDPEFAKDPDTKDIKQIALSYTFFPMKEGQADETAELSEKVRQLKRPIADAISRQGS